MYNIVFYHAHYRYQDVVMDKFPLGWRPDCVVLEGMFMVNTTPLRIHTNMREYVRFLLIRYAGWYLKAGVQQIHVVFDNPDRLKPHPKKLERSRRDAGIEVAQDHSHMNFSDETIPSKWREVLECRQCKRRAVEYVGDTILSVAPPLLQENQLLFVAGSGEGQDGDKVWCTSTSCIEVEVPALRCNAEEADTRVWLHAKFSSAARVLVFSPDTDVYHIGLAAGMNFGNCEIIVQLSSVGRELQLLHMNHLIEAMHHDPSLHSIPRKDLLDVVQMVYITTGCDFTSFFVGLGKVMFLKTFYACSDFISSGTDPATPGTLACRDPESSGFLSFIRLVGASYFAKHRGAFFSSSAANLYNQLSSQGVSPTEQHQLWYNEIRSKVWERILHEEHLPPTIEALELHWLRSVWVAEYWQQACNQVSWICAIYCIYFKAIIICHVVIFGSPPAAQRGGGEEGQGGDCPPNLKLERYYTLKLPIESSPLA